MAGLIDLKVWQLIFNILNTLILFLALRHFLFKPVKEFMDKRTNEIQSSIEAAEKMNEEAEGLYQEYNKKLQSAHDEGREIVRNSTKNAERKSEEILTQTKEEVIRLKEKANKDIELEKQSVINSLKEEVAGIALLAAESIISKSMDSDTNKSLIDEVIKEIGDEKWSS